MVFEKNIQPDTIGKHPPTILHLRTSFLNNLAVPISQVHNLWNATWSSTNYPDDLFRDRQSRKSVKMRTYLFVSIVNLLVFSSFRNDSPVTRLELVDLLVMI